MNHLKMKSTDLTQVNINKIAELFPNVITEARDEQGKIKRAIDFDLLRQELSDYLVEGEKERYQLTWPGKKEAILHANVPIDKTLLPVKQDSVNWDITQNIYIEGDNFKVLKLLQESYLNKVKCIYIDPPYNTGKDFIYIDDYKVPLEEYLEDSGQIDDDRNRLFQNTESNGRFHSDWLSEMYPRIKIARDLLREDGLIFISIDDNEMTNMKKLCDELFGASNFVANLIWANKEGGGGSDSKYFRVKHEYILCYAKSIESLVIKGVGISNEDRYTMQDEYVKRRGKYYLQKLNQASIQYSSSLDYPISAPDGTLLYPAIGGKQACWRWSEAKVKWGQENGFIVMKKDSQGDWQVYSKQYMNVDNNDKPIVRTNRPLGLIEEYSSTQASKKLESLFNAKVFDYSKPHELIHYLLSLATEENDIVLDFFSGSATTAHAVMQLNAEDQGNRRFIMVQLPEKTTETSEAYKAGYVTICEIGKERIRRAAKKIKEETGANIDYGFRVYRLDSSNMKDIYYTPDRLGQMNLDDMASNIKEDRTGEDLLIQVMLECGLELSLPMESKVIEGKTVHYVAGNSLIACFDDEVSESVIKKIAEDQPLRVVFRDSSFRDDSARINVEELFKLLSPSTEIQVL
ncbi:site-specific DNA-methyltransferase [Paenibacillus sp. M1]|uniref:Site-specific DNA-methyltransferase n=1 Tax=Paenibacillus haidiansis TaxID=1574488 RepID=A0ABU7VRY1_9BACL